jgi:hypothetical protein
MLVLWALALPLWVVVLAAATMRIYRTVTGARTRAELKTATATPVFHIHCALWSAAAVFLVVIVRRLALGEDGAVGRDGVNSVLMGLSYVLCWTWAPIGALTMLRVAVRVPLQTASPEQQARTRALLEVLRKLCWLVVSTIHARLRLCSQRIALPCIAARVGLRRGRHLRD